MKMMRTDDVRVHDMNKDVRSLTLKIKEVNSNFYIMYQYSGEPLIGNVIVYVSKESLDYFYQIFDDSFTYYPQSTDGMTRTELRKVHEIVDEFIGGIESEDAKEERKWEEFCKRNKLGDYKGKGRE